MNLTSPTQIRELLERYETRPTKRFGQNFLINKGVLEKIVKAGDIKKDDLILEIGPGIGVLTKELAKKAEKVFAIEKDKKMAAILAEVLKEEGIENVEIINEDVLKLNLESGILNLDKSNGFPKLSVVGRKNKKTDNSTNYKLQTINYKLIANIPYNITSNLIRKFLEEENKPTEMILMVQKEVAQRICEKKKMSLLSLSVQFYADPEILFYVSKGSFFPSPKIDSAIIKITPKKEVPKNAEDFFKVLKAGFSNPRKLLLSNLSKNLDTTKEKMGKILEISNIDKKARAEDLSLKDWIKLSATSQFGSRASK